MWLLALGLGAAAVALWPEVPDRIPLHFGPDGTPDRWGERSVLGWFGLPLVVLAMAAGAEGLLSWTLARPEAPYLNLPSKEAILALPPERRAPVWDRVRSLIYAVMATCVLAFALIQGGIWVEAHGANGQGWVLAGGLSALVLPMAAVVWGIVRVDAEIRRQRER